MSQNDIENAFAVVEQYCAMLPNAIAERQSAMLQKVRSQLVIEQGDWMRMTEGMADVRQQTTSVDRCYCRMLPAVLSIWRKERVATSEAMEVKDLDIRSSMCSTKTCST
jgi:hypothetical protein